MKSLQIQALPDDVYKPWHCEPGVNTVAWPNRRLSNCDAFSIWKEVRNDFVYWQA